MAIKPIQTGQESNALSQILQGGSDVISGIFDKAIQLGRDASDRRFRQEQDMMALRQNETALAQRRSEGLSRQIADSQRFARSAFESDRRFSMDQERVGHEREYRSNRDQVGDLRYESERDYRMGRDSLMDERYEDSDQYSRERQSTIDMFKEEEHRLDMETGRLRNAGMEAELSREDREDEGPLALTTAQILQRDGQNLRRQAMDDSRTERQQRVFNSEVATIIASSHTAFPSHTSILQRQEPSDKNSNAHKEWEIKMREAASRDSIQPRAEVQAAKRSRTADEYVNLLSEAYYERMGEEEAARIKDERRKFWAKVNEPQSSTRPEDPEAVLDSLLD